MIKFGVSEGVGRQSTESLWLSDSHLRIRKRKQVALAEDTHVPKTAIKEEVAKVIGKVMLQLP